MQEGNGSTSKSAFFRAQTVGVHLFADRVSIVNDELRGIAAV